MHSLCLSHISLCTHLCTVESVLESSPSVLQSLLYVKPKCNYAEPAQATQSSKVLSSDCTSQVWGSNLNYLKSITSFTLAFGLE